MGWMMPFSKHVQKQVPEAVEPWPGLRRHRGDIRAPGQRERFLLLGRIETETEDGKATVEEPNGLHPETIEVQRLPGNQLVRDQCGHKRIVDVLLPLEDVPIHPSKMVHRAGFRIDVDRRLHHHIEATNLVEAERVIDMIMREEDCITAIDALEVPVDEGREASIRIVLG